MAVRRGCAMKDCSIPHWGVHCTSTDAYGKPDFAALAAAYGVGIAKNHPFVDGNKRAALLTVGLFLMLNGYRLQASQAETTAAMLAVAASELDELAFAEWIRRRAVPH